MRFKSSPQMLYVVIGAVIAILGMCLLVFALSAGALLWIVSPESSDSTEPPDEPTQSAIIATAIPDDKPTQPLVTATVIIPTILPIPSKPASVPTAFVPTLQMSSPEQAVRTYYDLVGQGRYDLTWPVLTEGFKQKFNCCAPNYNYTGYTQWWDSVDRVEFGNVQTISQDGNRAVVYVELYYVMNNGERSGIDSMPYITLVYDPALGSWRFEDKRATL